MGEAAIPLLWRVELEPTLEIFAFELLEGAYVACQPKAPWGPVDLDLAALLD